MSTTEQAILFGHLKQANPWQQLTKAIVSQAGHNVAPLQVQAVSPLTSTLVGAVLGTGGGALKHYLSDRSREAQKKDPQAAARRMAIGAILGGGVGLGAGVVDNGVGLLQLGEGALVADDVTPTFDSKSKVSLPLFGASYSEGGNNTTGLLPLLTQMGSGKDMQSQFVTFPW